MTENAKIIFEKFQVRKSKKQKLRFSEFVKEIAEKNGYKFKVEKGIFGAKNLIVGDVEKADVIYTAHYDTCAVLPFPNFITPKNFLIYLLYQLLIVFAFIFIYFPLYFISMIILTLINSTLAIIVINASVVIMECALILLLVLMLAGPANKHTANDNTSGVVTLVDIICALNDAQKGKAAFVFFDLEEAGLFGSMGFAYKHKKVMKNKLLINFDCVSDGVNFIFAVKKGAKKYIPSLNEAFSSNEKYTVEVLDKGVFYPSDQTNFPCGVGVAALKKSKFGGILYMNRIHTKRDIVFIPDNIEFLKKGSIKLLEIV